MNNRPTPRQGMILLIVLGMLALFSLLAVTYVVFSSQSRTASVALANRDYRGTNSSTLMAQVVKQVVRGTQDPGSSQWCTLSGCIVQFNINQVTNVRTLNLKTSLDYLLGAMLIEYQ